MSFKKISIHIPNSTNVVENFALFTSDSTRKKLLNYSAFCSSKCQKRGIGKNYSIPCVVHVKTFTSLAVTCTCVALFSIYACIGRKKSIKSFEYANIWCSYMSPVIYAADNLFDQHLFPSFSFI